MRKRDRMNINIFTKDRVFIEVSRKYLIVSWSSSLGDTWSIRITNLSSVIFTFGISSFEKTFFMSKAIHSLDKPPASTPGYNRSLSQQFTSPLNWRRICLTISSGVSVANASSVSCSTVLRFKIIRIRFSVHSCAIYDHQSKTTALENKTRSVYVSECPHTELQHWDIWLECQDSILPAAIEVGLKGQNNRLHAHHQSVLFCGSRSHWFLPLTSSVKRLGLVHKTTVSRLPQSCSERTHSWEND